MDVKTVNVSVKKQIDNNFPGSVLLSTVEMTSKCLKLCVKLLARGSWFHLSFEHFDVISVVDKRRDHGKLLSIC